MLPLFFKRNFKFCAKNPRTAWATVKAMRQYKKDHPVCEWDGKTPTKEVHHIIPVRISPSLAACPDNMFSVGSRKAHYLIGHAGRSWFFYVENLKDIAKSRQIKS